MKVRSLFATIVKRLGVRPNGWEEALPGHPTLGDVDTPRRSRLPGREARLQGRACARKST